MKIAIGRYRVRIGLVERRQPEPARSDGELRDHELAILQAAEREYREAAWAERSLLLGTRY